MEAGPHPMVVSLTAGTWSNARRTRPAVANRAAAGAAMCEPKKDTKLLEAKSLDWEQTPAKWCAETACRRFPDNTA